ncbi:hypothetical protein DL990_24700 [Amycolatopsis sp. WAC 01416]|nr:hypothetical protein DL990_24700 [Amycolatopsis sp. WAC 01416]
MITRMPSDDRGNVISAAALALLESDSRLERKIDEATAELARQDDRRGSAGLPRPPKGPR